jgi:mannose-6-phosphate isomerase-like protein (cupin superfamily)
MIPESSVSFCYDVGYMLKNLIFNKSTQVKSEVFQQSAYILLSRGFKLIDIDIERPWGFFLSVDENQAQEFIKEFYSGVKLDDKDTSLPLRPKFLGIAPNQKLSWQYHNRRSEVWRALAGSFDLITSEGDIEKESSRRTINEGDLVEIPQGFRHRGIGLDNWALVAEIWRHTDPNKLSDEDDIVRLVDDYNRQ